MPPKRRPLTIIRIRVIDRQGGRHPDVARRRAAEVEAEVGPSRTWRSGSEAEQIDRQDEEEGAPDVLDEAIGVLGPEEPDLATWSRKYSQTSLDEVARSRSAPGGRSRSSSRAGFRARTGMKTRQSRSPATIIITIWSLRGP